MAFLNIKKHTPAFLLLAIITIILLLTVFINNSKSVDNLLAINSNANPYLQPLPSQLIEQVKKTELEDSLYVYSVAFNDNPLERSITFINKNPSRREFLNQIQIHAYVNNIEDYKNLANYKKEFLDYSVKRKPVMYHYDDNNYSVIKVVLPKINFEKIYAYQPGIYKNTFEKDLFKPINTISSNITPQKKHLYLPVLHQLLDNHDIGYLPYKDAGFDAFLSINGYGKEKSATVVEVTQSQKFWRSISLKNSSHTSFIKVVGSEKKTVLNLLNSLSENDAEFGSVFNIKKLADYYAIINLCSDNSDREIGLIYNASENKLEPFYINSSQVGGINNYVPNEQIKDDGFLVNYINTLKKIGSLSLDELLTSLPNLSDRIKQLNHKDPSLLFESSVLKHNQLVLLKGINPSTAIKVELLSVNDDEIKVSISNISDFPISISNLNYRTKKHITEPLTPSVIAPNASDSITFKLPRSFENLFVHKKTKTTGFIFEKDVFDLNIGYKIGDLSEVHYAECIPYQPLENYSKDNDLFRSVPDLNKLAYLKIDEAAKTIEIIKNFQLSSPLIFPKGYTILAGPGITIDIIEGGKIISYSPLNFIGSKDKRIHIISSDKEGQGLLVLADGKLSSLKYLNFDGLTNPSHGMWSTTSAVTFYEAPVHFDYVAISNNTCEDAINVVRTHFKMTNTQFRNTQSDAFDGDFVKGVINSCVFIDLGNDAIDVSGSDLDISNVKIINAGDKGLSAGEDSKMKAQRVTISNCEIAVAGKDLSIVTVNDLNIKNTKLGFTAFQKKPEFGPSNITATKIVMDGVETKYLIEDTSSLLVDGEKIETEQNVKDRMYGVEFGRSSSETRERQREQ